jgi:voltage-gated potassium channel Kch
MKKPSLSEKLRYRFDNTLSRGPLALIAWLALVTAVLIAVAVLVDLLIGGVSKQQDLGPVQVIWSFVFQALVPNPPGSLDSPWQFLTVMLALTIGSLLLVSILIGILTTGIQARLEQLRKGRAKVIETGHTVILGWSEQIFSIISELVIANENQRQSCIVILGDKDKVEMEEEIRQKVGHTGRTRVVCRSGNAIELADLDIVSPQTARSIVLVSPDVDRPDAQVIKTMLALVNAPDRRPEPYHIVAAIRNPKNLDVARLVGKEEVKLVLGGDLIAHIIAQTCRQSGLSTVYTDLLDFSGSEFYFQSEPALVGKTFAEAQFAYEDSAVVGIYPKDGAPQLNPPMDTRIREGDQIAVIAGDDDSTHLSGLTDLKINDSAIQIHPPAVPVPERALILGWNWRAPIVVTQLDAYVPPGSLVTVVADDPRAGLELASCCSQFRNLTYEFREGDTSDRHTLNGLEIETYDHVIILCYADTMDIQAADARTLITLLHLRDIAERAGHRFSITTEMLDIRNRNLAEVTRADDFIVSDRLVSLLLAQLSENPILYDLFNDLFDPEGSEVYLKPAGEYVTPGVAVNFYTVAEAARRRGESAFGYRLAAQSKDKARNYGVVVNPKKSEMVTFSEGDRIIVLAES